MITIYYSPSCSSCRKVRKWFDEQKIPYVAKDIFTSLTDDDIKQMIAKSIDGTDEIISSRSKIVQEQHIDFDNMKISELVAFIKTNPSVLKRPIIVDDKRLQVGYNEEEIEIFIPQARRMAYLLCKECPKHSTCVGAPIIKEKTQN